MACAATLKKYRALEAAAQERLEAARKARRDMVTEWKSARGPAARFAVEDKLHPIDAELDAAGKAFEAARDALLGFLRTE